MKILYIASNPDDENTLLLEREITDLQTQFSNSSTSGVSFTFLPGLRVERFPREISRIKPDILHISSHGSEEGLWLASEASDRVILTSEALREFIAIDRPPRLVILNACNSKAMAESLIGRVSMAIGMTTEITNSAALESVRLLYERLLDGQSVSQAFAACNQMIKTIDSKAASAKLFQQDGINAEEEFFLVSPRVIAEFKSKDFKRSGGSFEIDIGIVGCPGNTHQVVFFTDDEWFIDVASSLEEALCLVARGTTSSANSFWADEYWLAAKDQRIFACGVTGDGEYFTTSSSLTEALTYYHRVKMRGVSASFPTKMATAIAELRKSAAPSSTDITGGRLRVRERGSLTASSKKQSGA
jgi:hypothetical protein